MSALVRVLEARRKAKRRKHLTEIRVRLYNIHKRTAWKRKPWWVRLVTTP